LHGKGTFAKTKNTKTKRSGSVAKPSAGIISANYTLSHCRPNSSNSPPSKPRISLNTLAETPLGAAIKSVLLSYRANAQAGVSQWAATPFKE